VVWQGVPVFEQKSAEMGPSSPLDLHIANIAVSLVLFVRIINSGLIPNFFIVGFSEDMQIQSYYNAI
jgi:hypothetical protein